MAFSDALDGKHSHKLNESGRQRDRPGRTQRRPVDRDYSLARSRRDCAVCRDICGGHCRLRTRLNAHGARRFFVRPDGGNATHLARWLAGCSGRVCLGQIASAPLGQTTPGEQPHINGGRPRNRVRRFSNCFSLAPSVHRAVRSAELWTRSQPNRPSRFPPGDLDRPASWNISVCVLELSGG